jgi:outer membrane receptor for ferrienterochelin and colicin
MRKILLFITTILISVTSYGQTGTVTGRILDETSGDGLPGANAVIQGTAIGSITDLDGYFSIGNVPTGPQVVVITYVGYQTIEQQVNITSGTVDIGTINLALGSVGLAEVEVIASVAIDRKTPVAVSTIKSQTIEEKVGNQEFPEILRYTPSVYVTKQGGGFGDSRINVRGFDQRNTAVMINGVPVNDMENGWVYWSNWAGLTDVSSRIQMQRGLSASKLAIASVGGTINIITNAAEMDKGGKFSVDIGNNGYQKYGIMLSTGLGKSGWAFTIQGTHTRGNGYVDGTTFRAYSYFMSLAKKINDRHTLVFTGLGAPQWHHQRDIGQYDGIMFQDILDHPQGIRYNSKWGEYNGEEFTWRRNFYHKPKFYANWYWSISNKTELATTAYMSFGRGGGTGPRGQLNGSYENSSRFYDDRYGDDHLGQIRFDDIDNWNSGSTDYPSEWGDPKQIWDSVGDIDNGDDFFGDKYVNTSRYGFIRRASMNSHNWYGILSTLTHDFNDNLYLVAGIDLRSYKGMHYRRITNLLGADAYFTDTNVNIAGEFISQEKEANAIVDMQDDKKLNYHNDGLVGWQGAFAQLEYSNDNISAHISGSISNQSFKRIDYFNYYYSDALSEAAGLEETMESEKVNRAGGNIKGGINWNITSKHNVFFNGGFYSRQPLFDAVFLNFVNQINDELVNEKVTGLELGYGFRSKYLNANVNLYRTTWKDRFRQTEVELGGGAEGTANLSGISQTHTGVEIELYGEIAKNLMLEVMFSLGDWTYSDNVNVNVYDEDRNLLGDTILYLNNVKVGDAAQTTARVALTYTFLKNFRVYGSYYYADKLFADFDPTERAFLDENNLGSLELPNYSLVDAGLYYDFKAGKKLNFTAKVNINNIFNETYISESESNVHPESGTDETLYTENYGYFGFGRTWNAGILMRW